MARILLIEDMEKARARLRRMLELIGHKVVEACGGEQGMRIFRSTPVDVVVTDLIMEGSNGIGLVLELHRANPKAVIIALHGGSQQRKNRLLAVAEKYGAYRTLIGPFDSKELLDAVNDCLNRRRH